MTCVSGYTIGATAVGIKDPSVIICSACLGAWRKLTPEAKLPPLLAIKKPYDDVIIIHNVGASVDVFSALQRCLTL